MDNRFPNIVSDSEILGGKPCVKGTRISVELIMEWLGTGAAPDEMVEKHPLFSIGVVFEAIRYAARFAKNEIVIDVSRAQAA